MLLRKRDAAKYIKLFLVAAFFALFTTLFYKQSIRYDGKFPSDLPFHIEYGVENSTYSLLITIIGALAKFTGHTFFVALFESSLVILTFLLAEKYIRNYFGMEEIWAICISACLLFLTSVYLPYPGFYFYKTSIIAQPWHNITYIGMRLFCIPVFFKTLEIIEHYQDQFAWKDWFVLAVPLFLCTTIKPNFLIDYSFTLLIVLVVDFLGRFINKTLTVASFMRYIYLGTVVFPAVFILLLQGKTIYMDHNSITEPSGIAVVLLNSPFFMPSKIAALYKVVRDTLLPTVFALLLRKQFTKKDVFVYLFFYVTLAQVVLLTETGPRAADGNFGWGILCAGYLLYVYIISSFVPYVRAVPLKDRTVKEKWLIILSIGLLLWHLISGLVYFACLMTGIHYLV